MWRTWARTGFSILLVAGALAPVVVTPASAAPGPQVEIGDASVVEGDSGGDRVVKIPVTLSEPSASQVDVTYTIAGGTRVRARRLQRQGRHPAAR